jgi:AraC family transcriptional regulator of adaptative response / DNA-3-methyladenine glycosylase II
VGERHLRRLFRDHLGTSPDAVGRTRRAHLARQLLVDTDLRVADVAFAAGFGSVRQCNDVLRAVFHATPTELRAALRTGAPAAGNGALVLHLAARPPFDGDAILAWLAGRTVPGLEEVVYGAYHRRVRVDASTGSVTVRPEAGGVSVDVDLPPGTHLAGVVAGVRRMFDLDADPEAVDAHLGADPVLAPLVAARPGMRVPAWWTGFEAGVRAVVGQQISVAAARTVAGRIVAAHGVDGTFPEPEHLVDAPLESLGMNGQRAATVRRLADAVLAGDVVLDGSVDHDELVGSLVALKGIGPWTAEYVALRTGEPDAFPAQDLHLKRVLGGTDPDRWRPWRAYAAMHLWAADPSELTT